MDPTKNQRGKRMWPSLPVANNMADIANGFFVASLVVGVVATIVIIWMSGVKESYWEKDRAESAERVAALNNDTARLQSENLALQTVLLPRRIELHDGKADELFAAMAEFKSVGFAIQPVNDPEARNLAGEIILALAFVGVRASMDEGHSGLNPTNVAEGVSVSFPAGNPLVERAGNVLADILTTAGFGVVNPVFRRGHEPQDPKDNASGLVSPIHNGVVVAVGQRPVYHVIAWINRERSRAAGNAEAPKAEVK
jgi:hypothetical protein